MAQFVTLSQARDFEIDGKTYDLINLIEALDSTPEGWVSPDSVEGLTVGQTAYVWAHGRLRRGVVAKLGRSKAVVAFTTQGALYDALRYGDSGRADVRVSDTAVQLSQIRVPAETGTDTPAVPAETSTPVVPAGSEMVVTGDMAGSAVVTLLEEVWDRIRENHPELPAVVMITGSGLVGANKWGHFRPNGWTSRSENAGQMHEMFIAGETLAKGAAHTLQTTLHEAAHTLARVRDLKDTSRQGRWHNATFLNLAVELGLEHRETSADSAHGFSFVTITEDTREKYADLLAMLDTEIRLMCALPISLSGAGDGQDRGGEYIPGGRREKVGTAVQSGNLKATCGCAEPNIIRASRKVLDLEVIRCDKCDNLFTAE